MLQKQACSRVILTFLENLKTFLNLNKPLTGDKFDDISFNKIFFKLKKADKICNFLPHSPAPLMA